MKLKHEFERFRELYTNGFLFDANSNTIYTDKAKPIIPPEYETWEVEQTDFTKYMDERLESLGITKQANEIELLGGVNLPENEKVTETVFARNKFGDIQILQYGLNRKPYTYKPKGAENNSVANREQYHVQTRLHPLHENMVEGKYDFSQGKNVPFWHKSLIELYENETECDTLILTEGQIKAFKGSMEGLPTVGITSISHFKDSASGTMHFEIIDFIKQCKVKNFIILWDGDCRNISSKALADNEDISKRPGSFYGYAKKIRELLQDFFPPKKLNIYFATIKSYDIPEGPKGLDDLLVELKAKIKDVKHDFSSIGERVCQYFDWTDITSDIGVKKLYKYFKLNSVKSFYEFHSDLIKQQDFIYFGSTYRIDKGEPIKKIDANVKNYKRIGTDYYHIINKATLVGADGEIMFEKTLVPWTKSEIVQDHGQPVLNHIEKFKGFTNIPDHVEYKPIVGDEWNLYQNVDHNARPGDWKNIEILLKHLFEEQYTMVLDYLSILYRKPMQKLPVVCLVSKLQGTGKSTFIYLLKLIFKQNMAAISNQDLLGDFNSHWTSKLVVASEETLLEKKEGYEKIKSLTTAKNISRNEKNKSHTEIPCNVHFVFCSNHENDFIKIDDYDSRLWIRKVGKIPNKIKKFDEKLENEIPFFVDFIQNREIQYKHSDRLYFHPNDFRTDAFHNVVKHSEPGIIKDLRENMIDMFHATGQKELMYDIASLKSLFRIRENRSYLKKAIQETLGVPYNDKKASIDVYYIDEENKSNFKKKKSTRYFHFKKELFLPDEKPEVESRYIQTSILDEAER